MLEMIITTIRPEIIIHLAALSESEYIMKDPFETIYINGVVACKICDLIHRHRIKTRLFNTCSSEMFNGHKECLVKDDDRNFLPTWPYAYAKILSYHIVEYYRNKYGYCFSNGILFPTESKNRKQGFLMKKIKTHIENWNHKREVLNLGCLYSYRNMSHVDDVVDAICIILEQEKGDNYVISGEESYLVVDIVIRFYAKHNIELIKDGRRLLEKNTKETVVVFDESKEGLNINGCSEKLRSLGWRQKYSFDKMLEML
jgi:GDP-mannose 4,6-dehydratase